MTTTDAEQQADRKLAELCAVARERLIVMTPLLRARLSSILRSAEAARGEAAA